MNSSSEKKAALLCAHAQDLSGQCVIAARHDEMDCLRDLQERKQTILEELTSILKSGDYTWSPLLQQAVGALREALRTEALAFSETSQALQGELQAMNGAQRRLTQVHRYGTAGRVLPVGGNQLSICG